MLIQLPDGKLRLYDPEKDPKPIYKGDDPIEPKPKDDVGETSEFAYETREQAKKAGLKRSDISSTVARVRNRKWKSGAADMTVNCNGPKKKSRYKLT